MNKPTLFIHTGCKEENGFHLVILDEFKTAIEKSGQKNNIDVHLCTVGSKVPNQSWCSVNHHDNDYTRNEFFSLGKLRQFCQAALDAGCNNPVGYIQSAGQFHGFTNPCITDRRHYLTYFTIERMTDAWKCLNEGYDVVGLDWSLEPNRHFSGNFWWTRPSYIMRLPPIDPPNFMVDRVPSYRHLAEFWIGTGVPKVKCMHDSKISVYEKHLHRYPRSVYELKEEMNVGAK